jgi:beta-lactamase class A
LRNRSSSFVLRWIYLLLISLAIIITIIELISFSRLRSNYPFGMTLGGVPVGGLDPQETSQRILQVYSIPIEIHYADAIIQLEPGLVGFEVDIESMLAAADLQRTSSSFWIGFWNFLWNRTSSKIDVPLVASVSEERLRTYLQNEIASRYDKLPTSAKLIQGTTDFEPGSPGQEINLDRSTSLISDALRSPTNRTVILSSQLTMAGRPPFSNLQLLIKQIIDDNLFDGTIGVFLLDLRSAEELHFAYQENESISIDPDIAFTASSTIKIPIMVSIFKKFNGVLDENASILMTKMLRLSENDAADSLMQILDKNTGPVKVTDDLKSLGLLDTFIAGYFYNNSPNLLPYYSTPANQRTDINTDPDWYSQTSPSDMGTLLEDIYQCSERNGGALLATFPGSFTRKACQQMIQYLKEDKIGLLIEAGVPDGTAVAHKHGWVLDIGTGVYHDISDAAIIFSPGGDYILTIYAYHPVQVIWEYPVTRLGAARMFADISRVVYNYFNLATQ